MFSQMPTEPPRGFEWKLVVRSGWLVTLLD
jgi:hypothetical protein